MTTTPNLAEAHRRARRPDFQGDPMTAKTRQPAPFNLLLDLVIENHYEGGGMVKTAVTAEVAEPSDLTDLDDWADEELFPLTGTGREEGDSVYFVEIVGVTWPSTGDPSAAALFGRTFEFGL